MGVHEDARQGTLVGSRLDSYIKSNPNVLSEQDLGEGLTPLAAAVVRGYTEEVEELLRKGANADARSRNGETPLLLAAWKTDNNRPRIIQLLLEKALPDSIDATSPTAENNTPLMFAIMKKDVESIRLLRKAGASLILTNKDNFNADDMAKETQDNALIRALDPDKERSGLAKLAGTVVSFLQYIVAKANDVANGVMRRVYGLNPDLNPKTDKYVNADEQPSKAQFVQNVDRFVEEYPQLKRFFKDKPDYIKELAQKAMDLGNDQSTSLGSKDLLPKTIKVSMHQQVIYCDDSRSMRFHGRWDAQRKLVERITRITTRILPEGEGVALRFINQDEDESSSLTFERIGDILKRMSWSEGNTDIGTYLKSKILEPLVYSKLESQSLERPLLISVITDGMPKPEKKSEFVNAIVECGNKLADANYPRESVKFMVGQVGTSTSALNFLNSIRDKKELAEYVFCTTDQLDAKFAEFHEREADLDRWLIDTLFEPIKGRKDEKDREGDD